MNQILVLSLFSVALVMGAFSKGEAQDLGASDLYWEFRITNHPDKSLPEKLRTDAQRLFQSLALLKGQEGSVFRSNDGELSFVCQSEDACSIKFPKKKSIQHGPGFIYYFETKDFQVLRSCLPKYQLSSEEEQLPAEDLSFLQSIHHLNSFNDGNSFFISCSSYNCMIYVLTGNLVDDKNF